MIVFVQQAISIQIKYIQNNYLYAPAAAQFGAVRTHNSLLNLAIADKAFEYLVKILMSRIYLCSVIN